MRPRAAQGSGGYGDAVAGDGQRSADAGPERRALFWLVLLAKNLLGVVFVLMGIAMLVLPGQGLLSIFVGVMLLNFPGKYRFERWLIKKPSVLRSINWLRRKSRRPPLVLD